MPDYTVKADVDTMLRANDKAAIRSAIGLGQTDAPTFLAQSLTGQSLTGTQATSLINLAATWDTTGTPSLIYARVTTTNANNNAKLLDLGTFSQGEVFSVNRYGGIYSGDSVSVTNGSHMSQTTVGVGPTGRFGFSSNTGNASGFVFSTGLYQDAAGILAQRNGTAKQVHRVYNTFLGTTANEWGGFDWLTTANTLRIGTEHGGTGTARPIDFVVGGAAKMSIAVNGNTTVLGSIFCGAASGFGVLSKSYFTSPSDGLIAFFNLAGTDFGRIQLGGIADTHPAIARDGAGIKITGAAAGSTSWIKVPAVAVSALPSAATAGVGARSFVNDALTPVFGSAVAGGGAVTVPVYSTGSAWNVG